MKLLLLLGLLGMVLAIPGGTGIDDQGRSDSPAKGPTRGGTDADNNPDGELKTAWQDSHVQDISRKGSCSDSNYKTKETCETASKDWTEADLTTDNQWDRTQGTVRDAPADLANNGVHVSINGIMTKKVPYCDEPFTVGAHTKDSKIEDMVCEFPTPPCPYPLVIDTEDGAKCMATAPICPDPLVFDTDAIACVPMIPLIGEGSAILDNHYIGAVLRQDGPDYANKAPRAHQPVENDLNDDIMVADRHKIENKLWNWEKVRRHTGH